MRSEIIDVLDAGGAGKSGGGSGGGARMPAAGLARADGGLAHAAGAGHPGAPARAAAAGAARCCPARCHYFLQPLPCRWVLCWPYGVQLHLLCNATRVACMHHAVKRNRLENFRQTVPGPYASINPAHACPLGHTVSWQSLHCTPNRLWQVLIASHKAWLKLQRCKDRFEPLLCLDALKTCSEKPSAAAASTLQKGAAVHSNSTVTGSGA